MKKLLQKKINTWLGIVVLVFAVSATSAIAAPGDTINAIIHPGAGEQLIDGSLKIGDGVDDGADFQVGSSAGDKFAEFDGQINSKFHTIFDGWLMGKVRVGALFDVGTWTTGVSQFTGSPVDNLTQDLNVDGNVLSTELANSDGNAAVCVDAIGRLKLCDASVYQWQEGLWGPCLSNAGTCSGTYDADVPDGFCSGTYTTYQSNGNYCAGDGWVESIPAQRKTGWWGGDFNWSQTNIHYHGQNVAHLTANSGLTAILSTVAGHIFSLTRDGLYWSEPPTVFGKLNCQHRIYYVDSNNEWKYHQYAGLMPLTPCVYIGATGTGISAYTSYYQSVPRSCDELTTATCGTQPACNLYNNPSTSLTYACVGGNQSSCLAPGGSCKWTDYSSVKTCEDTNTNLECTDQNSACNWSPAPQEESRTVYCADSAGNLVDDVFCNTTKPIESRSC